MHRTLGLFLLCLQGTMVLNLNTEATESGLIDSAFWSLLGRMLVIYAESWLPSQCLVDRHGGNTYNPGNQEVETSNQVLKVIFYYRADARPVWAM